jgi:hypothetical protein
MKKRIFCFLILLNSFYICAQFAPAAGQIGSTAIHKDSSIFVGWATECKIIRGYQDISNSSLGYASGGDSTMPVGIAGSKGVVSLGDGGTAILTFNQPISNQEGFDFAVFENSFSDDFLELAFVEVSSDGVNYFRFPCVSNTQDTIQTDGFGPTDPTKINNLAGKYRAGYGTPFDLNDLDNPIGLDLNHITHIKIIDVVGCIQDQYATYDSKKHKINDPWNTPFASGGFDLAGVGVINQVVTAINANAEANFNIQIYPNPAKSIATINYQLQKESTVQLRVLNATGELVCQLENEKKHMGNYSFNLNVEAFRQGLYFIQLSVNNSLNTKKIVVKN